jgi:hypothetical protein
MPKIGGINYVAQKVGKIQKITHFAPYRLYISVKGTVAKIVPTETAQFIREISAGV